MWGGLGVPGRRWPGVGGVGLAWGAVSLGAGRGRGVIKRVSKSALFMSFVDHGGGRT